MTAVKKKILWVSEYCIRTGFSRVSESLTKFLAPHFDITVLDLYRQLQGKYDVSHTVAEDFSVKVIGRDGGNDWSAKTIVDEMQKFDFIFILQDIWNTNKILSAIKESGASAPPIVVYFPVDALEHNLDWYENIDIVSSIVTYTEYGKAEVCRCIDELVGLSSAKLLKSRVSVIPHGIDLQTFYPLEKSKSELREKIYGSEKYNDHFIFLNANRNQPRKRLDYTMIAFKSFLDKMAIRLANGKPNALLHMHCGNTDDHHMNILRLAERFGISDNVVVSNHKHGSPQWKEKDINNLYNATDVGLNTSIGEGWGLCNTEHAAIGKPQIVPAHSACQELFGEFGNTARADVSIIQNEIMTTGKIVDINHFVEKMIDLYSKESEYARIAALSKDKFSSSKYQWQTVAGMWINIFEAL